MMPIINIHPLASESEAEALRLTLKDADKFGLYCCHDGKSAMWSVIPKIALEFIFNAETGLPSSQRKWRNLSSSTINALFCSMYGDGITDGGQSFARAIEAKLKEKNT